VHLLQAVLKGSFCFFRSKSVLISEERIEYLKELSTKEAIYERLASALGWLINTDVESVFFFQFNNL
jgi:hypothetical protein